MKNMLKGIPVYLIALVLIVGSVAGAGIWFLTVDVPVEYNEPVLINLDNERTFNKSYGHLGAGSSADFRLRDYQNHTHTANMTFQTFHQYLNITNPTDGANHVVVNVTIELKNADYTDGINNSIGFVVIPEYKSVDGSNIGGIVRPQNVSWNYDPPGENRSEAVDEDDDVVLNQTYYDSPVYIETNSLSPGDSVTYTVIYVALEFDENGDPVDLSSLSGEIRWTFEEITGGS